ncbi:uncharacterized protein LOC124807414 [Hydra vulgaris]|uniref:uncharacterized protein LOC124807414 n=1 Tax=Hydra vulgaris TaxID=6087 RepID=UPI001F5FE256|nr:uncharacterized protein LOC124807414 isoform X2 [Hydra vulgaris]
MLLKCPLNTSIKINNAFFGRRNNNNNCPVLYPENSYNCNKDVTLLVQNLCDKRNSCIIVSSIGIFGDPCYGIGKYAEVEWTCYENDNHINSSIYGLVERNNINLSIELSGNGYNVSLEYFFPPFITLASEHIPYRFIKTNSNPSKYTFSGYFENKTTINITLNLKNRRCLESFPIEIPIMLSYQNNMNTLKVTTMAYIDNLSCFDLVSPKVFRDKNALKEYYGRGILVTAGKTYLYICMNQHVGSLQTACYYSNNTGDFMAGLDIRVGCVLGHHLVTNELYAIHRNQKLYLYFDLVYKKWLALTNQQFQKLSISLDKNMMVNLEGNQDQIYVFGRNEWMGNAEGLFYRNSSSSLWTLRVKWNK